LGRRRRRRRNQDCYVRWWFVREWHRLFGLFNNTVLFTGALRRRMKQSDVKRLKTAEKKLMRGTAGCVVLVQRRDANTVACLDVDWAWRIVARLVSRYKYEPQQIPSTRPWLPTHLKGKTCWIFKYTCRRIQCGRWSM
jgi:hypothetical protein